MSLFSKFTFKFAHSLKQRRAMAQKLTEVLGFALQDTQNFDLKESTELLSQFLIQNPEHIHILFHFIESSTQDFEPLKIIQLLAIIHELLKIDEINQNIAIEIKSTKMLWIQNIGDSKQNVQSQSQREHCKTFGDELDMELQTKNLIFQYAQLCYFYIQRISLNVDLYSAVLKNKYPYIHSDDIEVRLMFTWCYKIQNIMNYATQLLEYNPDLLNIQYLIYKDLAQFQSFICQELNKVFESYATISTNDIISLYEIYSESEKHYQSLSKFHQKTSLTTHAPTHCELQNLFLQEFLAFVTKVKVLNKMSFKKSIKVPNEKNPCLGMQTKDTNIIHLKMESNLLQMEQLAVEDEETDEDNAKNNNNLQSRRLTNRGQTTFYHQ